MKIQSISVVVKDANQSGVGTKFLIISVSFTLLLNLSIAIWFFMNDIGRFLIKWKKILMPITVTIGIIYGCGLDYFGYFGITKGINGINNKWNDKSW